MIENAVIRSVDPKDMSELVRLCADHAAYEKSAYVLEGKSEVLLQYLFGESPSLYCLVVEHVGQLIGYTTYMRQFSTWDAAHYLYMDCLYLDESARGYGIGEQLVDALKAEASKLRCGLIQWQTPDFNTRAIKFYKRIGAAAKPKERFFLPVEN